MPAAAPPRTLAELQERAALLQGISLGTLAARVGVDVGLDTTRTKGKLGTLLELALGATGGSRAEHDFPALAVELKTVPVTREGVPRESTYVCTMHMSAADEEEWESSWVRKKLSSVLWVPIVTESASAWHERHVGKPLLWSPTAAQEQCLRHDYDEVMGLVALGNVEALTAHVGACLQVRPKAAHGAVRTSVRGEDGQIATTIPRGFYLRPSFTRGVLLGL